MADRNEVFRLILEGRDRISGSLNTARQNLEKLDTAIKNLKKNNIEEFPLFGGGTARRGPGGRFVKTEDISGLDRVRDKLRAIGAEIRSVNKEAEKSDKFPLFGGSHSRRGAGGRFVPRREREFGAAFAFGRDAARRIEEEINQRIAGTREEFKERKRLLKAEEDERRVQLTARQQAERFDLLHNLFLQSEGDEERIEDLRQERRETNDADEKARLSAAIRLIRFERRERERQAQEQFTAGFQVERAAIRREFVQKRAELESPDIEAIENNLREMRQEALRGETVLSRLGKRVGFAFGDIARGSRAARSGIKDLDKDTNILRNGFTRLGFAVTAAVTQFQKFVNLRWLFLTGIISLFLTVVVQLGTALVAVAASAIQAGAALGGALAAGLAQALPVVGLLAAAMGRFNSVLDAVKLSEKLDDKAADKIDKIRTAAQALADQQYNLKKAIEAVSDAQFSLNEANESVLDSQRRVTDAVKNLADARRQAARDIVDANFEQRDSSLALEEAELAVVEAKKKLREEEAKKRAQLGDQDEAAAALKEANERLRIAKTQGDQAEISAAQQQVSIAEQNLNAILDQVADAKTEIKDAELGVKRANLNLEQARVRNKRANEEASRARQAGIEGSDVVQQAQEQLRDAIEGVADAQRAAVIANRNVRDALHQVAIAHREVADAQRDRTDAQKGSTAADKAAQEAFADLSPAEKKLYTSLKRIRETFKRVFSGTSQRDGILGPITSALARFIDVLEKMLLDPKLQRAARRLAQALGGAIDRFADFVQSGEFKDNLLFFINQATNNIPKIVEGMLNLLQTFLSIARAATPIFNRLLDKFVGVTSRANRFTQGAAGGDVGALGRPRGRLGDSAPIGEGEQSRLEKFLASAEKHLTSWLKLGAAIGNVLGALVAPASVGGQTLIERFTEQLNDAADWLRENQDKVQAFFEKAAKNAETLLGILGRLGKALFESFSSDEFIALSEVISTIIIPGLVTFLWALGKLSQALLFILDIPVIGWLVKWAFTIAVAEKALNRLFPLTQKVTQAFWKLVGVLLRVTRVMLSPGGMRAAFEALRFQARKVADAVANMWKQIAASAPVQAAKRGLDAATTAMGKLYRATIDTAKAAATRLRTALMNAVSALKDMVLWAGRAALALGKNLLNAIKSLAAMIVGPLIRAIRLLRLNLRLLLLSSGIGAIILAGILLIENWDKVKAAATKLWKWLVDVFGRVVTWVKENWKKMAAILLAPFLIGGLLIVGFLKFKDKIFDIFKNIKKAIIERFREAINWVRAKIGDLAGWVEKKLKGIPGIGRFFGGKGAEDLSQSDKAREIKNIVDALPKKARGKARASLEGGETSLADFLNELIDKKLLTTAQAVEISKKIGGSVLFAGTGAVVGGFGDRDTVPAMLTPGEWVLNRGHQKKISIALGQSVEQTKAFLFGTNSKTAPGKARNNGLGKEISYYRDFNLVRQEDDNGVAVWFLELANGTFGQVTGRDAARIQKTNGEWIPNYVKRSSAGFKQNVTRVVTGGISGFSLGGIVPPMAVQNFATGGVVQNPGFGTTSRDNKTINQNFNVKTQGETDWGYVLRLAAINAQESF